MVRFQDIGGVVLVFIILGISLGIGAEILGDVQSDVTAGTTAYRAIGNATEGLEELASWNPTIALVIAAAIIISLIFGAFMVKGGGGL